MQRQGRQARRVVEARRPGHDTFCNVLLIRDGDCIALLVHALDDLRIEFDGAASRQLIEALIDLGVHETCADTR